MIIIDFMTFGIFFDHPLWVIFQWATSLSDDSESDLGRVYVPNIGRLMGFDAVLMKIIEI
jgi:hypothetical protein